MGNRTKFVPILVAILIVALVSIAGTSLVIVIEDGDIDKSVNVDQQLIMESWKELDGYYSEFDKKADNVVNTVDKDAKMVSTTKLYPAVFSNDNDDQYTYYVCITRFYDQNALEKATQTFDCTTLPKLITDSIIDPEMAENSTPCKVKNYETTIYDYNGRSYLCAVINPTFSFVIDYDPETLELSSVIKIAESILN